MLTEEQFARRKDAIGSSDVPALFGLSPWASAYDLWLDKTGKLTPGEEKPWMSSGNRLEPAAIDYAADELQPESICQEPELRSGRLLCHPDAIFTFSGTRQEPVEAKTSGINGPIFGNWGNFGTDEVPDHVLLQCMAHMMTMPTTPDVCHVPAILGGRGFGLFRVPLDLDIVSCILERVEEFWTQNVLADTPPEDSPASLDVLKRVIRVPETVAELQRETLADWIAAKEVAKIATQAMDEAQAELLTAIGTAEAGIVAETGEAVTYYEQTRASYSVAQTTFRVARYKPKGIILPGKAKDQNG